MKRYLPFGATILFFLVAAYGLVRIYEKGGDEEPLRKATIPAETIDWVNHLGDGLNDILSTFTQEPRPTPWTNDGDAGRDTATGLLSLEDDLFVIYYPQPLADQAVRCQRLAHAAIPRLKEVCGRYFYPDDMHGRKVPIYLTRNQKEFDDLMRRFGFGSGDWNTTAGIHISEVSPSGYYLRALALNGRYAYNSEKETQRVLWHEMTHYCFFASVDYSVRQALPMWCYEGVADYSSQPGVQVRFSPREKAMIIKDCDLTEHRFPYVFEIYQGGHSVYNYMESRYGMKGVKDFLQRTYTDGVQEGCRGALGVSLSNLERNWKASL